MRPPRWLAPVAAVLLATGAASFGTQSVVARTDSRTTPIVFIHGSDWSAPYGVSCPRSFSTMEKRLRALGHTGRFVTIGYYRYDTGCSVSLGHDGSHDRHYATGHDTTGGHTGQTDIRHLAYHLAWYVYDHFSKAGVAVDVVGHSMGPLLIQYALAQVGRHHPDFPPRLLVEDVVSLAGPYTGARPIIDSCRTRQCAQMRHGSTFLAWLRTYAANPQGEGGTDWTAFSSVDDEYVSSSSGVAIQACHRVTYLASADVTHADLLHISSGSMTAAVKRSDCPGAPATGRWYWPIRAVDIALTYRSH